MTTRYCYSQISEKKDTIDRYILQSMRIFGDSCKIDVASAQENSLSKHYIGLMPSVLIEPYDTINAIEVNCFPFLYEYRIGKNKDLGFQIRPMLNYRIYEIQSGFSHLGGSLVVNKYFLNVFKDSFWLKPQLGAYFTFTYNKLDKVQVMILGIEPGVFMKFSKHISMSVNLQPGIDYYPDKASKHFVGAENGFKGHFGFIFHIGYNF